jgi:hypothetical protein
VPELGSAGRSWAAVGDDPAAWQPVRDGYPDRAVWDWYVGLAAARKADPVLRDGDLRFLLVDDRARTLAYSRFRPDGAVAIVALNPDRETAARASVPMADARGAGMPVPDGTRFRDATGSVSGEIVVAGGALHVDLPALAGAVLVPVPGQDMAPPAVPGGLAAAAASDGSVAVSWDAVEGAGGYRLWRSPLAGGLYEPVAMPVAGTSAWGDRPGPGSWHYVVQALDGTGNASARSAEVAVGVVAPTAAPTAPGGTGGPAGPSAAPSEGDANPSIDPAFAVLAVVVALGALGLVAGAAATRRARRRAP